MLCEISENSEMDLYNYFTEIQVPYYFPVRFDFWRTSMFHDCDYDGKPLFSQLKTFMLVNNERIDGFIQFGLSNFVFDTHGEKDYTKSYGIIRNVHYRLGTQNAGMLLDTASEYFDSLSLQERYVFFHFFGMSCYARQGKLHESGFYMEDLLREYGFHKEHENVYFSKSLHDEKDKPISDISFSYANHDQSITFVKDKDTIGHCELYVVPESTICYLKWIYLDTPFKHQGLGTQCMKQLTYDLHKKGFTRLDTDTIDSNLIAQRYYVKNGFTNCGIMRGYTLR